MLSPFQAAHRVSAFCGNAPLQKDYADFRTRRFGPDLEILMVAILGSRKDYF
jgi:hypothetical protein